MTDKSYFQYPASVRIGKSIWIGLFLLLVLLTFLTIGQKFIPDIRSPIQTPCGNSLSSSCNISIFFLSVSTLAMFLIINTRPSFVVEKKGITVRFFLKTMFLAWDELKRVETRKRRIIQYWIIYSERLPFFCRVYGFMFLNAGSGFLIYKSINNSGELIKIIQNNLKSSTKLFSKSKDISR